MSRATHADARATTGAGERAGGGDALAVALSLRHGDFTLRAAFAVPPGVTVLLGPSGAGKSLTLRAIVGLSPLVAGRVTLGARVLADSAAGIALPPGARRFGYVPQSYALFPHLTVAENVAYGLGALGGPARWARPWPWPRRRAADARRVAELLALVRLTGLETRLPRQLSGGQQQRVALVRALAAWPDALLLDEPLSALDAPTRLALREELRAVVRASGVPALLVTHDPAEARALADRLVVLVAGRVMAAGPLAEVLAAPPTGVAALLLGWRNVLPLARVVPSAGAGARVTLTGGQALAVACAPGVAPMPAALALHADRLMLAARTPTTSPGDAATSPALAGTLRGVSDEGSFVVARVALAGAAHEALPEVQVTCSPREWAALGLEVGMAVGVGVPEGAARLVAGVDVGTPADHAGGTP